MGDILDPLHSTLWLDTVKPTAVTYTRPWTDTRNPNFAQKLAKTTQAIITHNKESLDILRRCARGEVIFLPPANGRGQPDTASKERIAVKVHTYYMVGNHDWYYHLKGPTYDQIRKSIIDTLGLSNPQDMFPHELSEYPQLQDLLRQYKVFVRHGDSYDKFNFNREMGRNHATLGDVFTMDVCNRYPLEVQARYKDRLSDGVIDSLRRLTNVRPALATPLWISGQLKRHAGSAELEKGLKTTWDDLCDQFLQLPFVREQDKAFKFDIVDALEIAIKISKRTSFQTINDVVMWLRNRMSEGERSFAEHALNEPEFLSGRARFVIYGHTHHHEIVPLDSDGEMPNEQSQLYINSGTWHSYFDLAIKDPSQQKFIPYQSLTYLTFYKDGERDGRLFETWSGAYA
jgi:UDP-2,3-diacylglucosamine pyrophosphatase LpxH